MPVRTQNILGWIPTILVSLFMILASGLPKFFIQQGTDLAAFAQMLGVSSSMGLWIGALEILIGVLLLIPRTSTVGFVLLIGLLGGAMATGLTHEVPGNMPFFPLILIALASLGAYFRNPELLIRVMGKPVPTTSKLGKAFGLILLVLMALFHAPAFYFKYFPPTDEASVAMSQKLGLHLLNEPVLGIIQAITLILLFVPRTAAIGFLLMVGYMGAVLATFLTHGFAPSEAFMIFVFFAILTLSAYFRSPELLARLRGKSVAH